MYNTDTGRTRDIAGAPGGVGRLALSSDGTRLVVGAYENTSNIWLLDMTDPMDSP